MDMTLQFEAPSRKSQNIYSKISVFNCDMQNDLKINKTPKSKNPVVLKITYW